MMLDVKRFENLLEAGQRRAAELGKKAAPARKAHEEARAVSEGLQRDIADLQKRLNAFEAGEADMSDGDFMTARARIDLLKVKQKRAAEAASKAAADLAKVEGAARDEISELRKLALNEWIAARLAADDSYRKSWSLL